MFYDPNQPIVPYRGHYDLAHHDFQRYANAAVLPEMQLSPSLPPLPHPGHRSHMNRLAIQHEMYRRLEYMHAIEQFPQNVLEFCKNNLPVDSTGDADSDWEHGTAITVPAAGFRIVDLVPPMGKPADVDRVMKWVVGYPLATVNHIMHLVHPETADYTVQDGTDEDADKQLFLWAKWGRDENSITEARDAWYESVMVFVQPPWILTKADLEAFVKAPSFPAPNAQVPLKSHERVWAKVWDMCAQKHSRWFVLTSYYGWVFGAFSEARSVAFVSDVISWSSQSPTIVQCLYFWFSCAVGPRIRSAGPWTMPEVPEPVDSQRRISITRQTASIAPSNSELSWSARSSARSHTPSAVDTDDEGTVILGQLPSIPSNRGPQRKDVAAKVAEWTQSHAHSPASYMAGFANENRSTISAASVTSISSVSTVRDTSGNAERHGHYVMVPQKDARLNHSQFRRGSGYHG
ncbi:hypothetical protein BD413DRAFT_501975 [Trametes elegans]|nr:hypothetical protein BD413DRAFT_501975 [Trametes elegans]